MFSLTIKFYSDSSKYIIYLLKRSIFINYGGFMQKRLIFKSLVTFINIGMSLLFAQGITTSGLDGFVTDNEDNPLVGANVVAVHVPSGTQYGTSVRDGGLFTIPNMRVGGPYTITVSFIGYNWEDK